MNINRIELEDHPEYWDFIVQHITVLQNRMKMEGSSNEEIQKAVMEEIHKGNL